MHGMNKVTRVLNYHEHYTDACAARVIDMRTHQIKFLMQSLGVGGEKGRRVAHVQRIQAFIRLLEDSWLHYRAGGLGEQDRHDSKMCKNSQWPLLSQFADGIRASIETIKI